MRDKNKLLLQLTKKKTLKKDRSAKSAISINLNEPEKPSEIERVKTKSEKNLRTYTKMKTKILEEDEENIISDEEKSGNEEFEEFSSNNSEINNELDTSKISKKSKKSKISKISKKSKISKISKISKKSKISKTKSIKSKLTNEFLSSRKKNNTKHFNQSIISSLNTSIINNVKNNNNAKRNSIFNIESSNSFGEIKKTSTVKSAIKSLQNERRNSFLIPKNNLARLRIDKGRKSFITIAEKKKRFSLAGTGVRNILQGRIRARDKNERKIIIKTNVVLDKKFENEHCFDYTDSEDSVATEVIGEKGDISPITMSQLPESLTYFIKRGMKVDDLNKKINKFKLMSYMDNDNLNVNGNKKGKNNSVIYKKKKKVSFENFDNSNLTFIKKNKNVDNKVNNKEIINPYNENNIKFIDPKNVEMNVNQNESRIIFYKQIFFDAKELSHISNESFSIIDKSTDDSDNEIKINTKHYNKILKNSFDKNYLKVEHVIDYAHLKEIDSISSIHSKINFGKDSNNKKGKNKIKKKEKLKSVKKEEGKTSKEIEKNPIFKFEFYGQNNILQNYNVIEKKPSTKSNKQNKYKNKNDLNKKHQNNSNKTITVTENLSNFNIKENENLGDENSHNKIKFIDGKIVSYSNHNQFDILFDAKSKINNQ